MNIHIKNIIINRDKNISLLDNVLLYIKKNEKKIDVFDIAEIIKNDKTFYNLLYYECKDNNQLKTKTPDFVKLTDIFKGGDESK